MESTDQRFGNCLIPERALSRFEKTMDTTSRRAPADSRARCKSLAVPRCARVSTCVAREKKIPIAARTIAVVTRPLRDLRSCNDEHHFLWGVEKQEWQVRDVGVSGCLARCESGHPKSNPSDEIDHDAGQYRHRKDTGPPKPEHHHLHFAIS